MSSNKRNGKAAVTEEKQTCAQCEITRKGWGDNSGRGFEKEGRVYCCEGCSEETGCTCQALAGAEPQPDYSDQLEDQRAPESKPEATL